MHVVGTMHSSPPLLNDSKCFTKLLEFLSCLYVQVPLFQVLRFVFYTLTIIQASRRTLKHRERLHFYLVLLGVIMPLVYSTVSVQFSRSIYNKLIAVTMLMQVKFRTSVYTFFDYRWLCAYKQRSTSEKH